MTANLKDALMGGPGLRGYAYRAAIYCVDCGRDKIRDVFEQRAAIHAGDMPDDEFNDSQRLPQPCFFPESDSAEHCDECGEYCYGPQAKEAR